MADPIEAINNIGQKALAMPAELLNVGTRRVTEDMSMFSAKIQDLGTALVPPAGAGGLALPAFPPLPGMGAEQAAPAAANTRSEKVQGVRTTRKTSYLKV